MNEQDWLDKVSVPVSGRPAPPGDSSGARQSDTAWLDEVSRPVSAPGMPDPSMFPQGVYPRPAPLVEGEGEVRAFPEMVRSAVMGEGRMEFPDLPDIDALSTEDPLGQGPLDALPAVNKLRFQTGIVAASEPAQVVDIALQNLPGATARQDAMGNPIIDWQGQAFYAWKPGMRAQDVRRLAMQGFLYGGASKAAHAMTQGAGWLARTLATLGANAGASVGLDVGAGAAGSEQGVSVPRAVLAGGGAAAAEWFTPLVSRWVSRFGGQSVVDDAGTLTIEAQRVLREQGIDPATLTREQVGTFARMARQAVDVDDAARQMSSQRLPVPVRETRGSVTGNPSAQMFENQALEGVYGQQAQDVMSGVRAQQQAQIRANVPAIQSQLSPRTGVQVTERGQGGAAAQSALQAQQRRAGAAVGDLYSRARATPAVVSGSPVDEFVGKLNAAAGDIVQLDDAVRLKLTQLRERAGGDLSVDDLFKWRREVSALKNAASDRTRAKGLGDMLKAFDENVEDAVRQSLLAGDEQAAKAWLKAVKGRRAMGRRYGAGDMVEDLLETEYAGKTARLKVAPEAAGNYIFGKANLGFANKPELARDLMKIRRLLGRNSNEWNALREEAFLRFSALLEGGYQQGQSGVSGTKFLKGWENALRTNGPVMRTLFSENEIALVTQFGRVASRITSNVQGGRNYSGTSTGIAEIAKRIMGAAFLGPKGQAALSRVFPPLYDIVQTGRIARQVAPGAAVPLREVSRAVMGGGGALIGSELGSELQSRPQ